MTLKNKTAVITGGSAGLGKELAKVLISHGCKVVINSNNKPGLLKAAGELGCLGFFGDVSKEKDMAALAKFAEKKLGHLDMWVNNAGITVPRAEIEEIDEKKARQVFEVNFFGLFNGSRAAAKVFKSQKQGAIVNVLSTSALVGRPQSSVYSSSKWAGRGFTQALRMALEKFNVQVLAVYPGGMKTNLFGKHAPPEYKDWMRPEAVAEKIARNLLKEKPVLEYVIKN